jgi:predicted RNA-binding protein with PIN domain
MQTPFPSVLPAGSAGKRVASDAANEHTLPMPLLIDGYNLMYAAGIVGSGGPKGLERSRAALIRFVAGVIDDSERGSTTIVFDAAGAPPGLPATLVSDDLTVRFSKGYADADELLEELIEADHAPRRLTVVSSDHRVQRAAKRRRARAIDSDVWVTESLRRRTESRQASKSRDAAKPQAFAGDVEVKFWLDRIVADKETDKGLATWNDVVPVEMKRDQKSEVRGQKKKKKRRL